MDKFEMNELLDFYGGLLTENQQKISNDYFREDYSYQEIAENMNISRTAVYDTIKRVKQELENYEFILGCNKAYKNRCSIYKKIEESTTDENVLSYIKELESNENGGYYE